MYKVGQVKAISIQQHLVHLHAKINFSHTHIVNLTKSYVCIINNSNRQSPHTNSCCTPVVTLNDNTCTHTNSPTPGSESPSCSSANPVKSLQGPIILRDSPETSSSLRPTPTASPAPPISPQSQENSTLLARELGLESDRAKLGMRSHLVLGRWWGEMLWLCGRLLRWGEWTWLGRG